MNIQSLTGSDGCPPAVLRNPSADPRPRHFTALADLGAEGAAALLDRARAFKAREPGPHFAGRLLAMVFFNPSLRTRVSFQVAMQRGGGDAVVLDAGNGIWRLETRDGAVMDADAVEHIREAAPVLGRYADALAVRTFAGLTDQHADDADSVITAFRQHAGVPVISMESAREHPCQGLADLLTIQEASGQTRGLPVTLTWAPHVKPLPRAVPNSFLLTAAALGCDVRLAYPPGFELHREVLEEARALGDATGGRVSVIHDQAEAIQDAAVVYAKSWGPWESGDVTGHPGWRIGARQMALAHPDAALLHCLPVRRNVEVDDAVLDRPPRRVIDQAENRLHVQRAVLDWIWNDCR